MYRITGRRFFSGMLAVLAMSFAQIAPVLAEVVDNVVMSKDANGDVDAVIRFTVPVQYLRHFPEKKSPYLEIYFNILDTTVRDQWKNYESHTVPSGGTITGITTTTRDLSTGPKLVVDFDRPVEYTVRAGSNGRTLLIHIKSDMSPPAIPGAAAPVPQAGVGKDGLPLFPRIEPPQPVAPSGEPGELPSLADQVKIANNQAGELMAKGRQSLLAGEMYGAVEIFNQVLNLPPNKYSADAQVWVGIAREKSGQAAKAKLEYETFLKLFPEHPLSAWVKNRLAKLNAILPAKSAKSAVEPRKVEATEYQFSEYGSLSMYYYHGASQTDTLSTPVGMQNPVPTSLSLTDQSSMITNVSATARAYNNEYDNRLVFQDFYSRNFLRSSQNRNRLNAAYFETKSRIHNFQAKIGLQSAYGGGVLGRFEGMTAGYGLTPNWRANVVGGQLSEATLGDTPKFLGVNVDFGLKDTVGGSVYAINQTVGGVLDRRAVGGLFRYFDADKSAMAMIDFDTQFKELNMLTLQGTLSAEGGVDYNLMIDRRKSSSLSIRNAVSGTTASVNTLLQNGWTQADLIDLANQRTALSTMALLGVTTRIQEKWQLGWDVVVSKTTGLNESGTLLPDGTTGLEGYVPASASTGNTWTLSERLIGNDVITGHDVTMFNVSVTKSKASTGKTLLMNHHAIVQELWALDSMLRLYWQSDSTGGKQAVVSPVFKLGYRLKTDLNLDSEFGLESTKSDPGNLQSSRTVRKYFSFGFRWDF